MIAALVLMMGQAAAPAFADGGSGGSGSGGSGSGGSGGGGSGGGDDGGGDDNGGGGEADGDDDDKSWSDASAASQRGDIASLPSILKLALANTPGKVIDVKLQRRDGSYFYRIKILTNTHRKVELLINARTRTIQRAN